jgi:CelD/BcsL family acetyltransferase involved in cellulose biosynthesis
MSDLLMAEAVLGRDAREFLSSEIGQYIVGRAGIEKQEAQDQLSRVSPWRRNRIRQLQNEVWRAESVVSWLAELITNGQQAEAVLEEINATDD